MHETFWTLLGDPAHWMFELFLMLLFDGLIVGLCWPFVRKHWQHHVARDRAETTDIYGNRWQNCGPFTVPPECVKCDGEAVLLDTSVVMCKECGHVTVPERKE
jgi:hypothetical protein